MSHRLRVHVSCPDDRGLLASFTGRIFELGGDLADARFALLGRQAEMTCVCNVPDALTASALRDAIAELPGVRDGEVSVERFDRDHAHADDGRATHVIRVHGRDQPGLVARLAEGFAELGANVVRMDADVGPESYTIRFEVWVPEGNVPAVIANASNTAEALGLTFSAEDAARD